ncbi:hypothetical protein [Candidatus Galacturonibacter soehngenii]|uniref:Uncharacterized protein n=1 Tax=Candidatus Galacturonatibacter soehngenii TaxID=2307010 RepID=A0A7V7QK92_9FIRM|nr:hypothetical protein [Candidatus Galacturonibacter soehngenii]KAB1438051.1 hypothetical protein F7O84_10815 [Candidatus Galacturonibacter soehngenii]MBA4688770.1 hypothetical protein [Candidatus Galacturonibacter soehngenii]
MEELLRGYVNHADEQLCFYFENTINNIANFIFNNKKPDNEVVVETIFGKELLKATDHGNQLTGKPAYVEKIDEYLHKLKSGSIKREIVEFLDFSNLNNRDEFDSKDIEEKEFIRLYDGH